ncbi:MAG: hypothetical protein ACR2RB_11550, partial [Gammaproteobacteria bacterium]
GLLWGAARWRKSEQTTGDNESRHDTIKLAGGVSSSSANAKSLSPTWNVCAQRRIRPGKPLVPDHMK